MAKCKICEREMLTADGCIGENLEINGKKFPRIRHSEDWRCGDCGCKKGQLHHWGCDMERCPACGNQLISCDCEEVYLLKEE